MECDGVTGIGKEYRDSPEEEVIYSTWRRSLWNRSQKETGASRLKIYLVMCAPIEGFCRQRDKTHR